LDTYDRYIEPMTDLMDTGAGGTFYPLLEQTEAVLDALSEQLAIQGALISHQRSLQLLNFRVKDLRRIGRETLKYCTNTLMPLREEIRRHNQLSTAVAKLLGDVRKRGLKRTFANSELPLWLGLTHEIFRTECYPYNRYSSRLFFVLPGYCSVRLSPVE